MWDAYMAGGSWCGMPTWQEALGVGCLHGRRLLVWDAYMAGGSWCGIPTWQEALGVGCLHGRRLLVWDAYMAGGSWCGIPTWQEALGVGCPWQGNVNIRIDKHTNSDLYIILGEGVDHFSTASRCLLQ